MGVFIQLSAGTGPKECGQAIEKAAKKIIKDASKQTLKVDVVEQNHNNDGLRSIVLSLEGEKAQEFATTWEGSLLWVCALRSGASRKNWFFNAQVFTPSATPAFDANEIEFQTTRSSGAGGQHVNTTNSAVQAVHRPTGLSVRVETQRSQHANKKLAIELLELKHHEQTQAHTAHSKSQQRMQHHTLERGNPKRVFHGLDFIEKV